VERCGEGTVCVGSTEGSPEAAGRGRGECVVLICECCIKSLQLRWRRDIHAHGPRREGAWGV